MLFGNFGGKVGGGYSSKEFFFLHHIITLFVNINIFKPLHIKSLFVCIKFQYPIFIKFFSFNNLEVGNEIKIALLEVDHLHNELEHVKEVVLVLFNNLLHYMYGHQNLWLMYFPL
jgi:hypothetical protein